jgi:hypothetical protein
MRVVAILLFVATVALIIAGLTSHSVQKVQVARAHVKALHLARPAHGPNVSTSETQRAEAEAAAAERETKPFFYIQILLTAILLPFCLFLVLKRYQDVATKTFAFSSLGAIIAFWFYIPPSP